MENKEIIDFYDGFVEEQHKSGINERIYELYKRLKKQGFQADSNVLELGCGIGTLTFLLSKVVKTGKIEAVDISPESIEFCKKKIKNPNVAFFANDIVNYLPQMKEIDFISLFDIIEHIPLEKHGELFHNLSNICSDNTLILINIPNPDYIHYDIANNPDALQIVDQPVPLDFILQNLEHNNLSLVFFETHSIWVENDYQFFLIKKKRSFKEVKISDKRTFIQKAMKKIERTVVKLKYYR
ncbi:MAG: class I SAM-dependent methyltransferase [Bacteroidetes bacterium]|nr:class I SAM-dependent methyltransferase [Bacteroidota bacterium]